MYLGPLENIAISAAAGAAVGAIDAIGFYYTAKYFLAASSSNKKMLAGAFEFFRLIILVALIIFLSSFKSILFLPLACFALLLSLGGKMVFIFKGLKN
jgi:hypothetical protein